MHLRFFWIPAQDSQSAEKKLNRSLFAERDEVRTGSYEDAEQCPFKPLALRVSPFDSSDNWE